MHKKVEAQIGGKSISIETGKLAKQASGSIVIQSGETMVLVTAVAAKENKPEMGFLPLTIEYQEKLADPFVVVDFRATGPCYRAEAGRHVQGAATTDSGTFVVACRP